MGVCGFTTFIDNNNYLLEDFKLRNTKLVIDGNNFYHFIYYHYNVPHIYTGDYKHFAIVCRSFFDSLKACNVTPYVIFDGTYDLTDVKFNTAIIRSAKKVLDAHSVSQGDFNRVLPLLTHEVFVQVLNELEVKHATCNFEADTQTASLAAFYNCPVLTNDSDFFVTNLPAGVLLLDYFEVTPRWESDGSHYMKTQLFKISNLVKQMKLPDSSFVALFATILGNDIVDRSIFDSFLDRFCKLDFSKKREKKHFQKIKGLFQWLSKKRSLEGAVNDLLLECSLDKRDKIQALIMSSLDTYTITPTYLVVFFEDNYTPSKVNFRSRERMVNRLGEECPKWLQSGLNRGDVSARVLNLWMASKVILQPQIGCRSQASSHLPSRNIRRLIHVILSSNKPPEFREYVRKDGKLSRQPVKSVYKFLIAKYAPTIENLFEMTKEDSLNVYLEAFPADQNCFLSYPEKDKLIISVFLYWLLVCKPLKSQLLSLLLAVFVPEVMIRMLPFKLSAHEDLETAISKHLNCTKQRRRYFNLQAIHSFTQFQSCLQWLLDLNALCNHPLSPFLIYFNASSFLFIHHYIQDNNKNLNNYLEKISSNIPNGDWDFVSEMYEIFESYVTLDCDDTPRSSSRKNRKNKSKKKVKVCEEEEDKDEEEEDKDEEEDEKFYDVENKFSCLEIRSN